ncbi:MAG TPA: protein kinase [Actinomycetota bacterium]|nr:protein kinase [Actinomycetota bacterium]
MQQLDEDVLLGDRYRLVRMIGSGGMGTVWEAEDETLGRPVAVKVLSESLAAGERAVRRFEREAKAAARLSGPYIAAVYDFGRSEGRPYIVMELVSGETLADRLAREGPLPPQEASRIAAQVAEALEEAHAAGIVHRDVKPGNVMLTPTGDVRVMDFGIAAAAWAERVTTSGLVLGTPSYLAPEQAKSEKTTPASDVYALGAMLYEMVAGRPPFVAETPVAVALAHIRDDPLPLDQVAEGVPPNLASASMAALAKDPTERPPSAAAFTSMLRGPNPTLASIDAPKEATPLAPAAGPEETTPLAPAGPEETTPLAPVALGPEETIPLSPVRPHGDRRRIVIPVALIAGVLLLILAIVMVEARDRSILQRAQREARLGLRVAVPELSGMTVAEAKDALSEVGLGVEVQRQPGEAGIVISSDPPAGERVRRDTSVTLIVGARSTDEPPKKHHDNGKHRGEEKND